MEPTVALVVGQYLVAMISSGFNAVYFWGYRSPEPGRRVGAAVMAFLSLATFLETLMLSLAGRPWTPMDSPPWLGARLLVALASLLVSLLILRRWLARRF